MTHHHISSINDFSASLSFTGVPYTDVDRTDHWAIWCMSRLFEAARQVALRKGFLDFYQLSNDKTSAVLIKQKLILNEKLHKFHFDSQAKINFDLQFLEVGKTSVVYMIIVKDLITGECLAENYLKMVRIDNRNRRPVPLPEAYRKKFSSVMDASKLKSHLIRENTPNIPFSAYKYRVIPSHSDTDRNKHVNQSSYIKYCMDCATSASLSGYYTHFDLDMCLYPSLEWAITYIDESVANDELDVFTWQNYENKGKISFGIVVKDKIIFHAETLFSSTPHRQSLLSKM